MASAFAEFVQKLRSSSGKLGKSERSDHRACMISEKSCRRRGLAGRGKFSVAWNMSQNGAVTCGV